MLSLQMQMRVGISPENESACISNLICAKNRTAGFVCVTEKSNNFDVRFSLILDIRLKSGCQQIFIRLNSAKIEMSSTNLPVSIFLLVLYRLPSDQMSGT